MGEQDIGYHHGHSAHKESGLTAEGNSGDDDQRQHRLELGQHKERRPPGDCDGTQNSDGHQLSCLGFAAFKHQEERHHAFDQHQ